MLTRVKLYVKFNKSRGVMAKTIKPEFQQRIITQAITGGALGANVIQVVKRNYEEGLWTNDILINGKLHSPANGDSILQEMLTRTQKYVLEGINENS